VLGAVLVVIAMVIALPVGLFVAGAIWSALIGWFGTAEAEERSGLDSEVVQKRLW
jgi:hypothetical protein